MIPMGIKDFHLRKIGTGTKAALVAVIDTTPNDIGESVSNVTSSIREKHTTAKLTRQLDRSAKKNEKAAEKAEREIALAEAKAAQETSDNLVDTIKATGDDVINGPKATPRPTKRTNAAQS